MLPRFLLHFLFVISVLGLGARSAQAQYAVSGIARDSLTQEPLGFASVFLANTTYGTTTDAEGHFTLRNVAAGYYDLVISYLGYRLYRRAVVVQASLTLMPFLTPAATQLREVIVRGRRHRNKPEDYQQFEQMFLGTTSFSKQCRILNKKDVLVDYDPQKTELTATSYDFVQVENHALGYRIKYYGFHFKADLQRQVVSFYGQPVFEELLARNSRQQQHWAQNRQTAYYGSLTHFLRAVYDNQLAEHGFLAQKVERVPNLRRLRADSLLQHKLATAPPGTQVVVSDSLQQVLQEGRIELFLHNRPLPIDSLRRMAPDVADQRWLRFHDQVQVTYQREKPDAAYGLPSRGSSVRIIVSSPVPSNEISMLHLFVPEAQIQPNGHLVNPLLVFTEGYWAFERMGEFLPYNYEPLTEPQ